MIRKRKSTTTRRTTAKQSTISKKQAGVHEGGESYSTLNTARRSIITGTTYASNFENLVSDYERTNMLGIARYLYSNIGGIRNAILDIANYSVGNAFLPQFVGEDKEWGEEASKWLNNWFNYCDVRGSAFDFLTDLSLVSVSVDRDGDCLLVLTKATDNQYPLIQWIPAHLIGNRYNTKAIPSGRFRGFNVSNGVITNKYGRIVGYNILGESRDGSDDIQISVNDGLLAYEPEYLEQGRGLTALASAINDFRDYRDIRDYEKIGIKTASSIALIEDNETGGIDPSESHFSSTTDALGLYVENLDGGNIRYFRANSGAGLKPFESNRPGRDTAAFLSDHVLRNAYSALNWPYELGWDLSRLNGTSTRVIINKAQRKLDKRQAVLYKVWKRTVNYALAVAIKYNFIPNPGNLDWTKFEPTFPSKISIDLGRDSNAAINEYKIGMRSLSGVVGETGDDWKKVIDQKITEAKYIQEQCAAAGVNPTEIQQLTPNGNVPVAQPITENENSESTKESIDR